MQQTTSAGFNTSGTAVRQTHEYRLVSKPGQRQAREVQARRNVDRDEWTARHTFLLEEGAQREAKYLTNIRDSMIGIRRCIVDRQSTNVVPWASDFAVVPSQEVETQRGFNAALHAQRTTLQTQYSATGSMWLPHKELRELHHEWCTFYAVWRSRRPRAAVASALLSSFICMILIDHDDEASAARTRGIMQEAIQVTDDAATTGDDSCPYDSFCIFLKSVAQLVNGASVDPMKALDSLVHVLLDRVHRAHA